MEWLLFTYWLPPEPSRKRVFVWRQLKKIGALSTEGASWLLPRTDPLSERIIDIVKTVEELGGTANLYIVTHFSKEQEERAIAKFKQGREREYSQIITVCYKALKHIEREYEAKQFNFEEVEELVGDLEKINRWYSEARKRDFWETATKTEVERMIKEIEESLAAFTHKTFEETTKPAEKDELSAQ